MTTFTFKWSKKASCTATFVAPGHFIESWGHAGQAIIDLIQIREGTLQNPRTRFGGCNEGKVDFDHTGCANTVVAEFTNGYISVYPDRMTSNGARKYILGRVTIVGNKIKIVRTEESPSKEQSR